MRDEEGDVDGQKGERKERKMGEVGRLIRCYLHGYSGEAVLMVFICKKLFLKLKCCRKLQRGKKKNVIGGDLHFTPFRIRSTCASNSRMIHSSLFLLWVQQTNQLQMI